ncbi:Transcription factor [Coemansia spiralis]|nr:Transcription factor [Coemansia spiralis]
MATHRRRLSKLSQEPNPFEQSFSLVRTTQGPASGDSGGASPTSYSGEAERDSAGGRRQQQRPKSSPGDGPDALSSSHRVKLPPVAAINGPIEGGDMSSVWGAESLRSGPLSPAMLGGPTEQPAGARAAARQTPRLGVSDPLLHTGLTPYIAAEAHPAAAAVGFHGVKLSTAAMVATPCARTPSSSHALAPAPGPLPLDLADHRGRHRQTLSTADATVPLSMSSTLSLHDTRPQQQQQQQLGSAIAAARYTDVTMALVGSPSTSDRPLVAAESGARVGAGSGTAKRRPSSPPSGPAPQHQPPPPPPGQAKRARSTGRRGTRTASDAKPEEQESGGEEEPGEHGPEPAAGDDEERRRQFLERNRVAALKCRQRKKRQLQELQERYDYMVAENERLRAEFSQVRDYAMRARALLAAHADCPVARASGVFGPDSLHPASISMPPSTAPGGPGDHPDC